jgi:hypothetical protein
MSEDIQIRLMQLVFEEISLLEKLPVSPERLHAQYLLRSLSLLNLTGEREIGPTSLLEDLRIQSLRKLSVLGNESIFSCPKEV